MTDANFPGEFLETVDSTQDSARRLLAEVGAGTVVFVVAKQQRAGRGRDGRSWENPPGASFQASFAVQGPLPVAVLVDLPRRAAHAVLDWIDDRAVTWKAPNDIVAADDGAKVGGVLVDARTTGGSVNEVVIGIGLNLAGAPFTTGTGRPATSIEACLGRELPSSADELLVDHLCGWLADLVGAT